MDPRPPALPSPLAGEGAGEGFRVLCLLALAVFVCLPATGCRKQAAGTAAPAGPRVVSLAPNLTEIVCAIGAADLLVGRTSACNYPPAVVTNVPVVGGFGTPSLETLLAAQPTLILEVDLEDEALGRRLDELGLARKRIACRALDDIPKAIREVGECVNRRAEAARLAGGIESRLADLRRNAAANPSPVSVYAEIWDNPLMTAGKKSFVAELIRLAGGRNVGDEADGEYFTVSYEWVVSKNPDVVLCLATPDAPARENVLKRPGWEAIRAVREGKVYDRFPLDVLTRPGPRVLDGIEELRSRIAGTRPKP